MEVETVFDEIYQFTKQKNTDQYQKATIILDTFKQTLDKMGINSKDALGYLKLTSQQLSKQCQENKFSNLESYLLLLNKIISKCASNIISIESNDISMIMMKILNNYDQHEILIEKYCLAILGQCLALNCNINCFELLMKYSLSKQSQLRRESLRVIKQVLNQPNFELQNKINNLIKQYYFPNFKDIDNSENINIALLSFNHISQQISVQLLNDFLVQFVQIIEVVSNELQIKFYLAIEQISQERTLNQTICETLLNHFLQYYPSYDDQKQIFSYIQCISQVLLNLQQFDIILCQKYLGKVVLNISDYILQVNDSNIQSFAKKTIEILILKCIDERMWTKQDQQAQDELDNLMDNMQVENNNINYFYQFVCIMKNMLTDNENVQQYVLPIIGSFFSKINKQCYQQTIDLVKVLVQNKQQYNLHLWEKCLEKLIFSVDVECLLNLYPIQILNLDPLANDFEHKSNLFILSLSLKYAKNQKLSVFLEYIYPLLNQIQQIKSNDKTKNTVFDSIFMQVWDCFHRFTRISNEQKDKQAFEYMLNLLPKPSQTSELRFNENDKYFLQLIRGLRQLFENCIGFQVQQSLKVRAKYFIGQFAKIYQPKIDTQKNLLGCIQTLVQIVEPSYCEQKYYEHMKKLLENDNNIEANKNKHQKNLEIILRIVSQVKLQNDNWQLTIEVLKQELLQQTNNHDLQKKMYKLLQIIIKIKDTSFLDDIIYLLVQSQNSVSPKSKFNRLQVIQTIFELKNYSSTNQIFSFLKEFLPEIITYSRDPNQKLRKLVDKFLDQIYDTCNQLGISNNYIQMISAGFTSQASCTIADTIQVLAQFIDKTKELQILNVILQVSNKNNKEVYKACLFYIKHYIKLNDKNLLQNLSQQILTTLLNAQDDIKNANQSQLKFIIERLIRKCGQQFIQDKFPLEHIKLLKSIQKLKKQEINKKQKLKNERRKQKEQYDKKNKDMDEEDNNDNNKNQKDLDDNMLLEYDNENQKFHFVEKGLNLKKIKEDERKKLGQLKDIEFKNGKLVVKDLDTITGQKRKRDDDDELNQQINDEEKTVYQRRINKIKLRQQSNQVHQVKESGESYRAKGASKGDVQLKDKPEPYAFIQLNPKALNKRYRNKSRKVFDNLVQNKKTGVLKGLKTKKN